MWLAAVGTDMNFYCPHQTMSDFFFFFKYMVLGRTDTTRTGSSELEAKL